LLSVFMSACKWRCGEYGVINLIVNKTRPAAMNELK